MSFKAENMSVSRAFRNDGNKSGFTARPRDRLVEIVEYNLPASVLVARDTNTGKLMDVIVDRGRVAEFSAKAQSRGINEKAPAWMGYLIDANMAKELPVGTQAVLEATVPRGRSVKRGDQEYMQIECRYVSTAPKLRHARITADQYNGRVSSVQEWDEQALDVTAHRDQIMALFDKMDAVQEAYARQENPIGLGIQLRGIVPTAPAEDGTPTYEAIDTTNAFYWVAPKKDEAGNKIADGRPLGKEDALALVEGYIGYLNQKFPEGTFPADQDFRVEVMPFQNYKASIQSKAMVVNDRSPIGSLVTTPTKCAQDDTEYTIGRNWAVDGFLALTGDVAPKKPGDPWVARNMVDKIFANGYRTHVAAMVKAADGGRVRVHPALLVARPDREPSQPSSQASSFSSASSASSAPDASSLGDGFSGSDNPFERAMATAAPSNAAPATAAPSNAAPATNAPATNAPATNAPATSGAPSTSEAPASARNAGAWSQRPRRA